MITKQQVIEKCSDLMFEGAYVEAIEAMAFAQQLGVKVAEEEITDLYELKVSVTRELTA